MSHAMRCLLEEILGALHFLIAILLFYLGWSWLAWVFIIRAIIDEAGALYYAWKSHKEDTP